MLKLAIIGTGWISRAFIDAALSTEKYELTAVYSRRLSSAEDFTRDFDNVKLFDNLDNFFQDDFDLVYIASPNSLHFAHAQLALKNKKNVIVEKPAFSNPTELAEIIKTAEENNVLIFEAARNIHEKSFTTIKNFLDDKTITGADFTYAKYSSKMKALLAGDIPNTFSAKFSGGALADLGVYALYAAAYLFGKSNRALYQGIILNSGVDINGVGCLEYDNFNLALKTGKNLTSNLPSEIYTTDGTLTLDGINAVSSAVFETFDGQVIELDVSALENPMAEEAWDFAEILLDPTSEKNMKEYEELLHLAQIVANTSFEMRKNAGIKFEADKND
ncbi:Gfo/Idh/MocA family protein [Floricoccus penangensis]|uniref:Gfo/Idh/MocA family protein n=1 Tax=Floricoccus penangensis TaxID=1859475 RepID=UPI00203DED61|nr:Gfo/Idh/MocA family oxidoreductase [Floricoccus penangensis]URZ86767.1 Gfo/Idh/MocA family oxidoreductase [Floricoccus penangensis]